MPTYRTKGIVIKRIDFSETDRLLTIFTSTLGKVRAVAKGVRRTTSKMGGHLEIFNVVDLMMAEGRNLETITSSQAIESFPNLRASLRKTSLAYYIIELVNELTPDEHRDSRVFNLMAGVLKALDNNYHMPEIQDDLAVQAFKVKLLQLLGFAPQLDTCTQCGMEVKENNSFNFSNHLGGLICDSCNKRNQADVKLSATNLKLLRVLQKNYLELIYRIDVDKKAIDLLASLLDNYIKYIIEKEPKSLDFIRKVEKLAEK